MDDQLKAALISVVQEEFFSTASCSNTASLAANIVQLDNDSNVLEINASLFPERLEKRRKIEKTEQDLMNSYRDPEFHRNFRMKKETFLKLCDVIRPHFKPKIERGDSPIINLTMSLMITLYYLSRQLSMRDVGEFFDGVSTSVVCNESKRIVNILCTLTPNYIKWPSVHEVDIVTQQFSKRSRIPGVIGAIDGCHVEVVPPSGQQRSYIDRKFNHSILLQGVCSASKIFTNVSIGTPGRRHDVTALRNSSLWKKLQEEGVHSIFYDDDHHLVGDSGYMCRSWCLTLLEFNASMTLQQRRFNYALSRSRIVIEHTFGLLKGRWRRLLRIWKRDITEAIDIILACCVLHNFCYLNGDKVIDQVADPMMARGREQHARYNNESEAEKRKGKNKRDNILALFARE